MAYYDVCALCGAYLDPGERCDCKEEHMVHRASDEIEDLIAEIIMQNPRLSTNGIINKLKDLYGVKLTVETAHKIINRMTAFSSLHAERSSTGVTIYYYAKEA
jgi:hypothetical protein